MTGFAVACNSEIRSRTPCAISTEKPVNKFTDALRGYAFAVLLRSSPGEPRTTISRSGAGAMP